MKRPLRNLAHKRTALMAHSAACRARIETQLQPFTRKIAAADRAIGAVKAHHTAIAAAFSVLAMAGPRGWLGWAARLLSLYSLLRRN